MSTSITDQIKQHIAQALAVEVLEGMCSPEGCPRFADTSESEDAKEALTQILTILKGSVE